MSSSKEFWLCLHALSRAYEAEGPSAGDRAELILAQFLKMPPIAQREVLDSFWPLALHLPDLYQRAAAAHGRSELADAPSKASLNAG